jgi:hypothetical protein
VSHSTEHITDPRVYRLRVAALPEAVVFAWDYPGATLLEVRIVRSREGFARDPDDPARPSGQRIVFQGVAGSFRDQDIEAGRRYFYTIYARRQGERQWAAWDRKRIVAGKPWRPGVAARLRALIHTRRRY